AYIYRGGVTFVQIKRLVAAPAALAGEPLAPGKPVSTTAATQPAARPAGTEPASPLPDAGAALDEAFGEARACTGPSASCLLLLLPHPAAKITHGLGCSGVKAHPGER